MSRKSFVLYTEWEDAFDNQPNDVAGELIKTIFDYVRSEDIPQIDNGIVNAMFSILKPAIDRNIKKYDTAIEQRKEAGKKSAEKRKRNSTTVNERTRACTDSVSESDSVSDSVSTKVDEESKKKTSRFLKPTIQQLQDFISEKKYSVNTETFFNYYEANGWKVGKNSMKDWKAAIRTWQSKEKPQQPEINHPFTNFQDKQKYDKF